MTDLGIPIVRFKVKGKDGRTIAAYKFGDPSAARGSTQTGRQAFPKKFKKELVELYGQKCALCSAEFALSYLQIDHRVPYEVGGQAPELKASDYMLVCRTCNRGKSWSCEHCKNWLDLQEPKKCQSCFWASPDSYKHIALVDIRRLNLTWLEAEVGEHDALAKRSEMARIPLPEYVKDVIRKHLEE